MEGPEVRADCPVDIRLTIGGNLVAIIVANVPMRVRNFLNRADDGRNWPIRGMIGCFIACLGYAMPEVVFSSQKTRKC
jgi:hypothetical protein